MQFTRLKNIVILVHLMVYPFSAFSSGGEAKKEGEATAETMSKNQKQYIEKSAKLNTLTNRIVEADKQFKVLVERKSAARTAEEKQDIIQQMVELNNSRNKDVESFNAIKSELTLRYPNQGQHIDRQYHTQSKRSLDEIEGVAGLDELLTRTKKIVERKFAPFMEDEEKNKLPPKVSGSSEEKPARLKLEK